MAFSNTAARPTACNSAAGVWRNDSGTSFQLEVSSLTCDGVSSAPDFLYTASLGYVRDGASLTISGEGHEYRYQGLAAIGAAGADCLFAWAEAHYPALFAAGGASLSAGEYYFRAYAHAVYLGISSRNNHVYFLSAAQLGDVGAAAEWLAPAGCE